ncbi:MAG: hypothetical protein H6Q67_726 [Firmicutes bacterium]|nr:hypothetical protein [Bacillota bacterium]
MLNQKRGWLTKLAVLFIFLLNVETQLVNTALGEIAKAFPGTDPVLINLISNFPVFLALAISFVIGKLAQKYDKKTLLITALGIYIIGGLGGAFINGSIAQILVMRALVGIGAGISAPLCGSIISDLYDGDEKATMLGWTNGFSSLLAILITMVSGWLCSIKWEYTFFAYAVFIVVLLLEIFALPSLPPVVAASSSNSEPAEKPTYTTKQKIKLALIGLYVVCSMMIGMLLFMKMPIMVMQDNLGDPLLVATAFSINTGTAFLSAVIFGYIVKIFKRYTLALYSIFTALAFLTVFNAYSSTLLYIGFALNGIAVGLFMPALQLKAISTGPRANATYATSVVLGAMFFGQIISTFIETALKIFGNPTPRSLFLFGCIMFSIYTIAYIIWVVTNPEKDGIPSDTTAKV